VRIRPWIIGVALIVGGFATHLAFEVWAAPYAGRGAMGEFACFEALLYAAGLGLSLVSLCAAPAGTNAGRTTVGWALWVVAALVAGLAVLRRLPP
jgi:hypothetical protein